MLCLEAFGAGKYTRFKYQIDIKSGEGYLRQFPPQVVSGSIAVHVTQQIILKTIRQSYVKATLV